MRIHTVTSRFILGLLVAAALVLAACSTAGAEQDAPAPAAGITPAALAFRNDMRRLWQEHVVWTRLYIVSVAGDLPDGEAAAGRLLQNQTDIAEAIKPYYGDEAGEQLELLLRDHILIAADLLAAAKAGDAANVEEASGRWNRNADEIATFLSEANPDNWPQATVASEMKMHLDLTLEEATARLKGDWAADIAAYDKIEEHILKLADTLSTGIITQFPEKFG